MYFIKVCTLFQLISSNQNYILQQFWELLQKKKSCRLPTKDGQFHLKWQYFLKRLYSNESLCILMFMYNFANFSGETKWAVIVSNQPSVKLVLSLKIVSQKNQTKSCFLCRIKSQCCIYFTSQLIQKLMILKAIIVSLTHH